MNPDIFDFLQFHSIIIQNLVFGIVNNKMSTVDRNKLL